MKKELKKIQEIKKGEILEKVNRLEKIAGTDKIRLLAEELDNEYNAENFDLIMNKVFNEEFYNEKDKNAAGIVEDIDEKKADYYTNGKVEFEENEDEDEGDNNNDYLYKKEEYDENDEQQEYNEDDQYQEEQEDENEWWYCDGKKKLETQ
jgi:hypothetical protein